MITDVFIIGGILLGACVFAMAIHALMPFVTYPRSRKNMNITEEYPRLLMVEAILRQLYKLHLQHAWDTDSYWDTYHQDWVEYHIRVDNYKDWEEAWARAKEALNEA